MHENEHGLFTEERKSKVVPSELLCCVCWSCFWTPATYVFAPNCTTSQVFSEDGADRHDDNHEKPGLSKLTGKMSVCFVASISFICPVVDIHGGRANATARKPRPKQLGADFTETHRSAPAADFAAIPIKYLWILHTWVSTFSWLASLDHLRRLENSSCSSTTTFSIHDDSLIDGYNSSWTITTQNYPCTYGHRSADQSTVALPSKGASRLGL